MGFFSFPPGMKFSKTLIVGGTLLCVVILATAIIGATLSSDSQESVVSEELAEAAPIGGLLIAPRNGELTSNHCLLIAGVRTTLDRVVTPRSMLFGDDGSRENTVDEIVFSMGDLADALRASITADGAYLNTPTSINFIATASVIDAAAAAYAEANISFAETGNLEVYETVDSMLLQARIEADTAMWGCTL